MLLHLDGKSNYFDNVLKTTKTDIFQLDISSWLGLETIDSTSVLNSDGLVTVNSNSFNNGIISAYCTGVSQGEAKIDFTFSTITRSGCFSAYVFVNDCC